MKPKKWQLYAFATFVITAILIALLRYQNLGDSHPRPLRVAVPPFVDTAFTTVGDRNGFFLSAKVPITLVDTAWENQYDLIAANGLDVAMSTLDEFVNKDRNLRLTGNQMVFFLPAWQFRGLGFYSGRGTMPFSSFKTQDRTLRQAKNDFLRQFAGRRIVYPEGSVFEQAFRAFCEGSDILASSFNIVSAPLDTALNSLTDASVGVVAVGSQQRFEAERRGHHEAISPEELGLDIITGFITRAETYSKRKDEILAFARAWYQTANFVSARKEESYQITNKYLEKRGSNSLTFDEYQALVAYNRVPLSALEAERIFFSKEGVGFWKNVWERAVLALGRKGQVAETPPDQNGFVAPAINELLMVESPK